MTLLILLLISCQRSQFATTTRTYRKGRVIYVKNYHIESRKVSKEISNRKQVKNDNLQSCNFSGSRTKLMLEIFRVTPVVGELSENLIASTATEPILTLVKEKNETSSASQRIIRNVSEYQDTIARKDQIPSGVNETHPADNRKIEKYGLSGFILSILGLVPLLGLPLAILGLVFGIKSLRKIKRNSTLYKCKGFAIASIILGVLGIVGTILLLGMVTALSIWSHSGT